MKTLIFKLTKEFISLIITGALCGLIVSLYQLGIQNIVKVSTFLYTSKTPILIAILLILCGICMVLNYLIEIYNPAIDGSGIPSLKIATRDNLKIKWYKDIPLQIINSFISTFCGFTLGSEGPSVVMASKSGYAVQEVMKIDKTDTDELCEGVGFGCAFLSPLAGIFYGIEEGVKNHITLSRIIRIIILMAIAFLVSYFLNSHHLLTITSFTPLVSKDFYIFVLLLIFNIIISLVFIKIMLVLRAFFKKQSKNKLIKNRSIFLFIITIILNFLIIDFMQSGGNLISNVESITSFYVLIALIIFRIIITAFSGSGSVTGGLVIPIMAIGAINGQIVSLISHEIFGFSSSYYELISLISALMLFGLIIRTPLTSTALLFSTIFFFTNDFIDSFSIVPVFLVFIISGRFLMKKIFKQDSLYDGMIKI